MDAGDGFDVNEYLPSNDRDGKAPLQLRYNENPLGPSPRAIEAVRTYVNRMHRYPGDPIRALSRALADRWDINRSQVVLGPGAVGVIDTFSRAMLDPGERILRPDPGFGYFAHSAHAHGGGDSTYPLRKEDDFQADPAAILEAYDGQPLIYLNTPHNPTGATISLETIEAVADGIDDDSLVIVDEAYGPFSTQPSAIDLVSSRDNVAVLRTFSKSDGLAGMRVGYALVPKVVAEQYADVRTTFSVSALSCIAALAALGDTEHREHSVSVARKSRRYMHEHIEAPTWPSEGNFVLVEVPDADEVSNALEAEGILVRSGDTMGLPSMIRVTVGTPEQTRHVVNVINRVIESCA